MIWVPYSVFWYFNLDAFVLMFMPLSEFMSRGSLYDFLHKQRGVFKLPSLLKVAIDVSKGMNYLHQNNIIHRDLKTANLLMDENEVRRLHECTHWYCLLHFQWYWSMFCCSLYNNWFYNKSKYHIDLIALVAILYHWSITYLYYWAIALLALPFWICCWL